MKEVTIKFDLEFTFDVTNLPDNTEDGRFK